MKADNKKKSAEDKQKPEKRKETTAEFIASMAIVLVTGLFIITFCLQAFEIPSSSMVQTLLVGDHLFVDRTVLAPRTKWMPLVPYRQIHRGDIVVFISPAQPGLYLVKRVIAIPGDRIHLRDGVVYINGQAQEEKYVYKDPTRPQEDTYRDNFPFGPRQGLTPEWRLTLESHIDGQDVVIPPGTFFPMGDNRFNSNDGRYFGFVPQENIIGRPMFIYWSFKTPDDQYEKREMADRLAFLGHIVIHFFDETRWTRTLRLVH